MSTPRIMPVAATLKDVARAAGVHPGTASRALNASTRNLVRAETVRRVQRAAESLGYRPNPIARSLKTARTLTIGVVIPDLTNPIFPPMIRGIESYAEASGYTALVVNTDGDLDLERQRVESLLARQVDGLIVATAMRQHPLIEQLAAEGLPLVLVNRMIDDLAIPSVVGDDNQGVALTVRHLTGLGHQRIAHVAGPLDTSTGLGRSRAYDAAIRDNGLTGHSHTVVSTGWNEHGGAEALAALLESGASPTAIVAGNDLIALGCLDVLERQGLRCPQDVSLVGFNDMPFLSRLRPPLTTIRVPHHELGAEAARMLVEGLVEPARLPRSTVLPVQFVERESTAAPAA